jgi:hypothetical protein
MGKRFFVKKGGGIPNYATVVVQPDPYSVPTFMDYDTYQDTKNESNQRFGGTRKTRRSKNKNNKTRKGKR